MDGRGAAGAAWDAGTAAGAPSAPVGDGAGAGGSSSARLRLRGRRAELHAENPAYPPIVPDPSELAVLGKVVEVHRFLE